MSILTLVNQEIIRDNKVGKLLHTNSFLVGPVVSNIFYEIREMSEECEIWVYADDLSLDALDVRSNSLKSKVEVTVTV